MRILAVYNADGTVKAIWNDAAASGFRAAGLVPRRASRVEVIETGPRAGFFCVDFSLLADMTGKAEHRVCLSQTFGNYADAIRAEVAWLETHYILAETS